MKVPTTTTSSIAVAVLATMVLAPALFAGWVWDDHQLIVLNPHVTGFDLAHLSSHHFWDIPRVGETQARYYRPLTSFGHALSWRIGGGDPLFFHAVNLLLHGVCTALTVVWLGRRLGRADEGAASLGIAMVTLLFALHPARVQTVAWISGSTDLWATLFVLVGLVVASRMRGIASALAVGTCFALAFLAKEVAIVAPAWLLLDRFALAEGERPSHRRTAAILIPVALAVTLRLAVVGFGGRAPGSGGLADTLGRVAFTLGAYLREALMPWDATVQLNATWDAVWSEEPAAAAVTVAGALAMILLLAATVLLYRRRRLRPWLSDLALFVLPVAVVSNAVPLGEELTVASRLLYLPLLGATALTARALLPFFRRARSRPLALGALGLLTIVMAVLSTRELEHWRDDVSLATHWREQRPTDPAVADNLARVVLKTGDLERAYRVLSERLDAEPDAKGGVYAQATWAYVRLTLTSDVHQEDLARLRRFFDAIANGERARLELPERTLSPRLGDADRREIMTNPSYGDFHGAWGWSHARTLDVVGALAIFEAAPEVTRDAPHGRRRLIQALLWNGEWDAAQRALEEARRAHPSPVWDELHQRMRAAAALAGDPPADPVDAATAKSRLMSELGLPAVGRAILAPLGDLRDPRVVHARVQAHLSDGRPDLAVEELERAIEVMPEAGGELSAALERVRQMSRGDSARVPPVWER